VIRADHDYQELSADDVAVLQQRTQQQGFTDEETLDVYRGRQVWIDHGSGIVTRYCHLESIESHVAVGLDVTAGERIGGIGESGTPESVTAPNTELHLHAEVRVGDSFLGDGLEPSEVRRLYTRLFSPATETGA
jgi:murein DD-endopeptidase MepM/ murein hydrolase activator NlpD